MPLELKERCKKQAEIESQTLSAWIFEQLEDALIISEYINSHNL